MERMFKKHEIDGNSNEDRKNYLQIANNKLCLGQNIGSKGGYTEIAKVGQEFVANVKEGEDIGQNKLTEIDTPSSMR